MKASDAFCEQPLQMDDYGRHGDCTISPTYDDEDTHHCGEDVNEKQLNDIDNDEN